MRRLALALRTSDVLFWCAGITIAILGACMSLYVDQSVNQEEYDRLIRGAKSAALFIDGASIDTLTLSEADLQNPSYQELKQRLTLLKIANPDIRFAYVMMERDGRVYFAADSEPPDSDTYSPPGQEYYEASPELRSGWDPNVPHVFEKYTDRWGDWISALAPIKDSEGRTVGLLGLDESVTAHQYVYFLEEGLVLLATLALLAFLSTLYHISSAERSATQTKAEFIAAASHELRTPLTAMRWTLSRLRSNPALSADARTIVNDLYTRTCSLIDLTGTFLRTTAADHGSMRTADFKIFDVAEMVRECISRARAIADMKNISVSIAHSLDGSVILRGDADRLRLVFDNLLSNAIKYSPDHSTVSVSFSETPAAKRFVIRDQGMGIPKDEIDAIFSGFYRAENAQKSGAVGSGFGLYIVRKIVLFHNGTITCESEPGHGTAFTVTLPSGV